MYVQKDNSCAIIKKVRIISIQNIFTKNICTLLILLLRYVIIMVKRERNIRGNREAGKMNMAGILGTVQNREVRKVAG